MQNECCKFGDVSFARWCSWFYTRWQSLFQCLMFYVLWKSGHISL